MPTYLEKKETVLRQYFTQYLDTIFPSMALYNRLLPQHSDGSMNVMHTMFLCSVIDYFGKIMRVGDSGTDLPIKSGQVATNFKFFILKYFPASNACKGDIIYKLFRNGVMHQFFPKASGVMWSNAPQHIGNLLEDDNGVPRMNNYVLSEYINQALVQIMDDFNNDRSQTYIENIYEHLILNNYGFDDYAELHALQTSYRARGKSFYDPC